MAVDLDATHLEHPTELGGIGDVDLQEQDIGCTWNRVHAALSLLLLVVLTLVPDLPPVRDQGQLLIVLQGGGDKRPGQVVELDPVRAQLCGARHPRDQRDHHDHGDEGR
jgi:hypothetical protein